MSCKLLVTAIFKIMFPDQCSTFQFNLLVNSLAAWYGHHTKNSWKGGKEIRALKSWSTAHKQPKQEERVKNQDTAATSVDAQSGECSSSTQTEYLYGSIFFQSSIHPSACSCFAIPTVQLQVRQRHSKQRKVHGDPLCSPVRRLIPLVIVKEEGQHVDRVPPGKPLLSLRRRVGALEEVWASESADNVQIK